MKRLNDSINHPLRFEGNGKVVGQFYNSLDKHYHLAEYKPYVSRPIAYLCGKCGNFSGSRSEHSRLLCADCWRLLASMETEQKQKQIVGGAYT